MRSVFFASLLLVITVFRCGAQQDTSSAPVYQVQLKYELPAALVFLGSSYFGFRELDRLASASAQDIAGLSPNKVNSFDRPVIFMDPSGFDLAQKRSDMFLNIAILSPLVLALDKQVRKDWLNLTTMFLVTHSVNNALYFAGAYSVRRYRPLTYSPGLPLDQKIGDAKTNSFFSGHVSFSATSTFFAAKVYTDYHHIRGGKRLLFYSAAAIPPLLVGYYRMKAGKHFRTDVGLGLLIGAASGILVPELHRKKNKHISVEPLYIGGYSGLTLNVGF